MIKGRKKSVLSNIKSFKLPQENQLANSKYCNPSTYAQNLDDDRRNKDDDPNYPTFSSRYAASFKNKITNLLQKHISEGICD